MERRPGRRAVAKPELQEVRVKILKMHASLALRQRKAALGGQIEKVLELEIRKQALIPVIAKTGPVPRRWMPQ